MFSVVNAILLKPLAYPDSGRLVHLTNSHKAAVASQATSPPGLLPLEFLRWRNQLQSFESIALTTFGDRTLTLTGTGRPEQLGVVAVTAEYFDTLRVPPNSEGGSASQKRVQGRPTW